MKKVLGFFLVGILFASQAYAARPLSTDDAGTVGAKAFELETGIEYVNNADAETNLSVALTAGLTDTLDFAIEVPYQFLEVEGAEDVNGLDDISLSLKWNFLKDQEGLPDMAIKVSHKLENANNDRGVGTGRPEYSVMGIVSQQFGDVAYHVNLGCAEKHNEEDAFAYNFAVEYAYNEKTRLVGEVFGDTVLSGKFDDNATSMLLGMNYDITDAVVWDIGWTLGLSDADPDYRLTTGFTIPFGG